MKHVNVKEVVDLWMGNSMVYETASRMQNNSTLARTRPPCDSHEKENDHAINNSFPSTCFVGIVGIIMERVSERNGGRPEQVQPSISLNGIRPGSPAEGVLSG